MKKSIALLLVASIVAVGSGCSTFSKSARRQRAYDKYVQKSSRARVNQRALFKHSAPEMPSTQMPSDPVVSAETGPMSFTSSEE